LVTSHLQNKNILITAGPSWVKLDSVRVISNIASGETGVLLANKLKTEGARVTLLLGPGCDTRCLNSGIELLRFEFFSDFKDHFLARLKTKQYACIVQTAALSDYKPKASFKYKVSSNKKLWKISLVANLKIIEQIRKYDPAVFLVGFKFEVGLGKRLLLKRARGLFKRANPDLVVANRIHKDRYEAYILGRESICGPWLNKKGMVRELTRLIRLGIN